MLHSYGPICTWLGVKKKSIRKKLVENLWYVCYYPTLICVAWWLLAGSDFFPWNAAGFWRTFPIYEDWVEHPSWYYYYAFQLGFYLQGIVALVSFETKRKDFYELIIHHAVTIFLIVLSYCASQHRLGLNVLIVHDFSDVLLYSTKVIHYVDKYARFKDSKLNTLAQLFFMAFAAVFAWSRNYVYPRFIIWPGVLCSEVLSRFVGYPADYCTALCGGNLHCEHVAVRTLAGGLMPASPGLLGSLLDRLYYVYDPLRSHWLEISHLGTCFGPYCFHSGVVLIWLMVVLEMLHIFWLFMILRMIVRGLRKKEIKQDIRSESEDEKEWNADALDAADKKKFE